MKIEAQGGEVSRARSRTMLVGVALLAILLLGALPAAGAGTAELVKDINPGASSSPADMTAVGSTLFFSADDGVNGRELWRSDGTEAGTQLVKDINPGDAGPIELAAVGSTLFFSADDGVNGAELWRSDGTEAGTQLVKDINPGAGGSLPSGLTAVGSTLFFSAVDGVNGRELWRSDGTEAGTQLVKDINPGASSSLSSLDEMTAVGSTLFFEAWDGVNGFELWRSDGTEAGTQLVKDINPNPAASSNLDEMTAAGATLFFSAFDGVNGFELWRSDGTEAGTQLVKDINPGSSSNPHHMSAVGSTLFFNALDGLNALDGDTGRELWRSDGTEAGTQLVKDINPGASSGFPASSDPEDLSAVGSTLFFRAFDGLTGFELWRSDGTEAGTQLVKDINPSGESFPLELTAVGSTLAFVANDGVNGFELWRSDGTEAGTQLVKDINPGAASSRADRLTAVGSTLFFGANDGVNGFELWKLGSSGAGVLSVDTSLPAPASADRFGRFEKSFTLSRAYGDDVFDPGVIKVSATFTAPSGRQFTVPAFWTQDYTVRSGTGLGSLEDYDPVAGQAGQGLWRVRFSPDEVGTYAYTLHAEDHRPGQVAAASSEPLSFQSTASGRHGQVEIDPSDPLLLRFEDGTPYLPIGHDVAFGGANPAADGTQYAQIMFDSMQRARETWTRVWMTDFYRTALEWSAGHWSGIYSGVGQYSQRAAFRIDRTLEIADERGLQVQLVLNDHGQFSTHTDARWSESPYSDANGGPVPAAHPEEFFTNAEAKRLMKQRLRYVVARYGAFRNVLAWELFNEVQLTGSPAVKPDNSAALRADIAAWHLEMAAYVKAIDPYRHLITSSAASLSPSDVLSPVWPDANIDLVQIHDYDAQVTRDARHAAMVRSFQDSFAKPVIIGEFGIGSECGFDPTTSTLAQDLREHLVAGTHVHNASWSTAMTRSGAMSWYWDCYLFSDAASHRNAPDFPVHEKVFPALAAFFAGEDLGALGLRDAAITAPASVQAFGLDNRTRGFVWVRDSLNEYGTGARPGDVVNRTISNVTVSVGGFTDGAYTIDVFDPYGAGTWRPSFTAIATGGALAIPLPAFTRDVALKIRPSSARADIGIGMTAFPNPVALGGTVRYEIAVTNAGPDEALNVTVTDGLPSGLEFVSAAPDQGSCAPGPPLTCSLGTLAVGASTSIAVVATAGAAGRRTNTATVSSPLVDPTPADNAATSSVLVVEPGSVAAWGDNLFGALGDGTTLSRSVRVATSGLSGVVAVSGGGQHSLALKSNGTVWAWGRNFFGGLGDGSTQNRLTPVQSSGLSSVVAIATGRHHSLALRSDGTVWAWGYNAYGQLGNGTTSSQSVRAQVGGLAGVVAIAAGGWHSLAVRADGTVWAWGRNAGRLGDGTTADRPTPVRVTGLSGVAAIAAHDSHSLALKSDGTVWAWGFGGSADSLTPVQVSGLSDVVAISAGGSHSLALKSDGTVWAWGANNVGQLGDGTATQPSTPVQASGLGGVAEVRAGMEHSVAFRSDGTVWSWGRNDSGQLGDGTAIERRLPARSLALAAIGTVDAGWNHTLALGANPFPPVTETASAVVSGGQTVTTDGEGDGATPEDLIETSLTSPLAGTVAITESPAGVAGSGYTFLGWQASISAPTATPSNPLVVRFRLESTAIPPGTTASTITVLRNGVAVPACTGSPSVASPDPCVSSRQTLADGDALITVLTSQASIWNLGVPRFARIDFHYHWSGDGKVQNSTAYDSFAPATVKAGVAYGYRLHLTVTNDAKESITQKLQGGVTTASGATVRIASVRCGKAAIKAGKSDNVVVWNASGDGNPSSPGFVIVPGKVCELEVQIDKLKLGATGLQPLTGGWTAVQTGPGSFIGQSPPTARLEVSAVP